jgi:hypothetical protein
MFAAVGLAWKLGGFREVFKLIPRWVWILIAVVLIGLAAMWWHGRQMAAFEKEVRLSERTIVNAAWDKRFTKMRSNATIWKSRYEKASSDLADARSKAHEKNLQSNAAVAGTLLVRGPGAAAQANCGPGDHSGLSTATGQHQSAAAVGNAAGLAVSPEVWAAVPWPWLVGRGQEHDDLLSEVKQWRIWHPEQAELLQQQKRLLAEQNK